MFKQLACKRALLLVAAMAATALAAPSAASAASWGPIGSTHVLDSPNLEMTLDLIAFDVGVACTEAQLHVDIRSAADATVTNLGFPRDCHGTDLAVGCTATLRATKLHWNMTGPTTNNVMIHGVHIDIHFETRPPAGSTPCLFDKDDFTVTGTLRGGVWDPTTHEITFNKATATGLTVHSPIGNNDTVTFSGTFRDTQQTLTLG